MGIPAVGKILALFGLDLNNKRIENVGTPTASADAVTKAYADGLGAYTLIGTLTTTSGTTQVLTGIPSGYKRLALHIKDVSHNGTSGALQVALSADGSNFPTNILITQSVTSAAHVFRGVVFIDFVSETGPKPISPLTNMSGGTALYSTLALETSQTGVTSALRFSNVGNYSFDAGSIDVYGVK